MTELDLIEGILVREGGYQDDPADRGNAGGGATNGGITSVSWGQYRGLGRPATKDEIRALTREDKIGFYQHLLGLSPFRAVVDEPLRVQLYDFAVNSGQALATRWLQRVLQVTVTSAFDGSTQAALAAAPAFLVNEALVGARARMIVKAVDAGAIAQKNQDGLLERVVGFSEIVV